jgi:hypothetical protein
VKECCDRSAGDLRAGDLNAAPQVGQLGSPVLCSDPSMALPQELVRECTARIGRISAAADASTSGVASAMATGRSSSGGESGALVLMGVSAPRIMASKVSTPPEKGQDTSDSRTGSVFATVDR